MTAYNDPNPKAAGYKQSLKSDDITGQVAEENGIKFGRPVFSYAGNDLQIFAYHNNRAKVVYDADFVTSNNIDLSVNGVAITTVPFDTNHDTTMTNLKNQIEADITGATVTLIDTGGFNRDFYITIEDDNDRLVTSVVTGGASQAVATITYDTTMVYRGITRHDYQEGAPITDLEGNPVNTSVDALYPDKEAASVMVHGDITVDTADAIVSTSPAYVVATSGADQGKMTDDPTNNVALPDTVFTETTSAAGLADVRITK
jgi:hypothetical protein